MAAVRVVMSRWIERVWYKEVQPPSPVRRLLETASTLWRLGARLDSQRRRPRRGALPTIGISSPTVGGSGKTPLACWVARRLHAQGVLPAVVTRGHGGRERGPTRVDPLVHHATDVGDEPLWLAWQLGGIPVIVSRDRAEGIRAAQSHGAAVAILDDAVMVREIVLDRELMVVGSGGWIGNGRCLPAGPLRVVPETIRRAHALVVVVEPGATAVDAARAATLAGPLPVVEARVSPRAVITPDGVRHGPSWCRGRAVLAWAGIARPRRFWQMLIDMDVDIRAFVTFPDHHPYSRRDVDRIAREAAKLDAVPLTTAKDRARWPTWARWLPYSLDVGLDLSDADACLLGGVLGYARDP